MTSQSKGFAARQHGLVSIQRSHRSPPDLIRAKAGSLMIDYYKLLYQLPCKYGYCPTVTGDRRNLHGAESMASCRSKLGDCPTADNSDLKSPFRGERSCDMEWNSQEGELKGLRQNRGDTGEQDDESSGDERLMNSEASSI